MKMISSDHADDSSMMFLLMMMARNLTRLRGRWLGGEVMMMVMMT